MSPPEQLRHDGRQVGSASLYWPGTSPAHRAPVWAKLLMLAVVSTAVIWVGHPLASGFVAGIALGAMFAVGVPGRMLLRLWRPILVVVALIAIVQIALGRIDEGIDAASRVLAIAAVALLFTMTTSAMDIVGWVERTLTRLRVRPDRVFRAGLAVGIATRSVDHLGVVSQRVIDARRSRGLGRSARAFAVPTVVAAGRFAHGVGEALEARGLSESSSPTAPASDTPYRMVVGLDEYAPDRATATWIPGGRELGSARRRPPGVPGAFVLEALAQTAGLFLHDHIHTSPGSRWLLGAVYDTSWEPLEWGSEVALECRLLQLSEHAARIEGLAFVGEREVARARLLMVPLSGTPSEPGVRAVAGEDTR